MGARYTFRCTACGYTVEVGGGDDAGMITATTTITCSTCKRLSDIVVGWHGEAEGRKAGKPRCPRSPRHPIEPWKTGGPCPVCGATMENQGLAALWD